MDWGMKSCPSDTLMQIRGRRDAFLIPCQGLILHPTIQLEDGSHSAAGKLEFCCSRRAESVNINRYEHRIKASPPLRMEECKEKSVPISGWLCLKMKNHCKTPPNPCWQQFPPSWGSETNRACNKLSVVAF